MNLDHIQARIRPRSEWEAIDLGFVFAREWFWPLWRAWVMLALPVFMIAHVFFWQNIWLAAVVLWWFKPLYEQPLLFILSRRLFNEQVDDSYLRRHLWSIVRPQLWANLSWRRFSLHRSFDNPVAMLEGLSGEHRKQRLKLLRRQQHLSGWLTLFGIHIETLFNLSLIAFVSMLTPDTSGMLELSDFFDVLSENYQVASWLGNVAYFLSLSVLAPFYVAGGFSLYLYSRVKLEGWEIEIAFRQMRQRLQKNRAMPLLFFISALLAGGLLPADRVWAQADAVHPVELDATDARQLIKEVLQQKDFGESHLVTRYRIGGIDDNESVDAPDWLRSLIEWLINASADDASAQAATAARILEVALWLGVLLLILVVWKKFSPQLRGLLSGRSAPSEKKPAQAQATLLSEQLALDSLPADITAEVQRSIAAGQLRQALSLLYRGSLQALIEQGGMEIPRAATEADCVALVARKRPQEEAQFFVLLTRHWLKQAYGHVEPAREDIEQLLQPWQQYFVAR